MVSTLSTSGGLTVMKQINPFPLIAMLVIVAFLVLWLNGYLV